MPRHTDLRRRCLPLSEWPDHDRRLWDAARRPPDRRFSMAPRQVVHRPAAWRKIEGGWGRYLGFLKLQGWLHPNEGPVDRPTVERLNAFFSELLELNNRDYAITGRFSEIEAAMRVFDPRGNHRWITHPNDAPLSHELDMRKREFTLHNPIDLYLWGLDLMERAGGLNGQRRRQVQMRDGLLIAILAFRGLRLRSVLSLTLGRNILRDPNTKSWRLELEPGDVKNGRHISMHLPEILGPWLDRYVDVERQELLAGRRSDAFWINWSGKPLGEKGLDKRIRWLSEKRFGKWETFGTHRFRHCIATSAALLMPEQPGLAASILHITHGVLDEHYDRSSAILAFRAYHGAVSREQKATQELARQAFASRAASRNRDVARPPRGQGNLFS